MEVRALSEAEPFTTADGSTIRELLGIPTAPVQHQSLAEATLEPGQATQRHYHALSEELYFFLEGAGEMEIDGETRAVAHGDTVLIPRGSKKTDWEVELGVVIGKTARYVADKESALSYVAGFLALVVVGPIARRAAQEPGVFEVAGRSPLDQRRTLGGARVPHRVHSLRSTDEKEIIVC